MGRRIRGCLAGRLVEVTCRTIQGRFLLRPSARVNTTIKGTLGRAQRRAGMRICAVVFLSNHYHLLLLPDSEKQLAEFVQFLNSNVARQLGRLHRWKEHFWSRRYQAIPVSDEPEAQIERLRYLLEQGVKEGLVEKPSDWPGVQCVNELTHGRPRFHGIWHERTAEYLARRYSGGETKVRPRDFLSRETVEFSPLPCLEGQERKQWGLAVRRLVREIVREARTHRETTGSTVVGAQRILEQDPHDQPRRIQRSPAPLVHAVAAEVYADMRDHYRSFLERYKEAAGRLRAGLEFRFPPGCFPPPAGFIPLAPTRAGPS